MTVKCFTIERYSSTNPWVFILRTILLSLCNKTTGSENNVKDNTRGLQWRFLKSPQKSLKFQIELSLQIPSKSSGLVQYQRTILHRGLARTYRTTMSKVQTQETRSKTGVRDRRDPNEQENLLIIENNPPKAKWVCPCVIVGNPRFSIGRRDHN